MKRPVLLVTLILFFCAALFSADDPFRDADAAYNSGNLPEALSLYQRVAVTETDENVRSEAWLRAAYIQYVLGKSTDAVESLEHAYVLNDKVQVDPNIYPPDFATLFDIAVLRTTLSSLDRSMTPEIPEAELDLPEVPVPEVKLPELTLTPLDLPRTTPFFVPVIKNPGLEKRDMPSKLDIAGEMVVALATDGSGKIQDINTVFSAYPTHDRALASYARVKWDVIPGKVRGRDVPSLLAYRLTLSSDIKGIKTIRANVRPIFKEDPIPVFLPEKYTPVSQDLPAGSHYVAPKDQEIMAEVKKVKVKFDNMDTRGTFKGIALLNKSGRVVQFRAIEADLPAAVPALRQALKDWTFTPGATREGPTHCYLFLDLEFLYTLAGPNLEQAAQLKETILPR